MKDLNFVSKLRNSDNLEDKLRDIDKITSSLTVLTQGIEGSMTSFITEYIRGLKKNSDNLEEKLRAKTVEFDHLGKKFNPSRR